MRLHLPPHPLWFWLFVPLPFITLLVLRIVTFRYPNISLRRFRPWLFAGYILLFVPYSLLNFNLTSTAANRALRFVVGMAFWSCCLMAFWIQRYGMFETLRAPNAQWFSRRRVEFTVPANVRILVRDIDAVSPWYVEKLGLRKLAQASPAEPSAAILRFKTDGNSIVLTNRSGFQTAKSPILFTKKIEKMRDVMSSRGTDASSIERDRQGIRFFQIHDPEGNAIEVVEG